MSHFAQALPAASCVPSSILMRWVGEQVAMWCLAAGWGEPTTHGILVS